MSPPAHVLCCYIVVVVVVVVLVGVVEMITLEFLYAVPLGKYAGVTTFKPAEETKYRHTMVENRKKHGQNSHLINDFPTSEGVSEVSERANE